MNKKDLSESDIKAKFITPAITGAGWDELTQLGREIFFSDGRILSFAIWFLDYSEWADGFRINSGAHNDEKSNGIRKSWMIYFLPLLKVAIITTIPALIAGSIMRLKKKIRIASA